GPRPRSSPCARTSPYRTPRRYDLTLGPAPGPTPGEPGSPRSRQGASTALEAASTARDPTPHTLPLSGHRRLVDRTAPSTPPRNPAADETSARARPGSNQGATAPRSCGTALAEEAAPLVPARWRGPLPQRVPVSCGRAPDGAPRCEAATAASTRREPSRHEGAAV